MYSSGPHTKNNSTLTQRFATHVFPDVLHPFDYVATTPRNAIKNEHPAHIYDNRGKRKTNHVTPLQWVKSHTSHLDIGAKKDGRPIHLINNQEVISFYIRRKLGFKPYLPNYWSKSKLIEHSRKEETYYFAASHRDKDESILIMIDVDCHDGGTIQGALDYCQWLKANKHTNLYYEPSPRGAHAYVILKKYGMDSKTVKGILINQWKPALNDVAKGFDVEHVEVKGLPPELTWADDGSLQGYKSGILATLPRGIIDRFDELQATTVIDILDLMKLPSHHLKLVDPTEKKKSQPVGSICGKFFGKHELAHLNTSYLRLANQLLKDRQIACTHGRVVTAEDVAIFLMIGAFFTNHMNGDGSMPYARWGGGPPDKDGKRTIGLWGSLYESGDITRSFDSNRFASIRNFLSYLDLIDWEDQSYSPQTHKAAKWQFSNRLMQLIGDTREEEEHPLQEAVRKTIANLIQCDEAKVIKPTKMHEIPVYQYNPDEVTRNITEYLALSA